jgi:hypothetical protein
LLTTIDAEGGLPVGSCTMDVIAVYHLPHTWVITSKFMY